MTAATQDVKTDKVGSLDIPPPNLLALSVAANVQIFGGTFAASDANGRAVPCTSSAALMLWGICDKQANNLVANPPYGAADAFDVQVRPGCFYFFNDGTVVTKSMMGQPVFALDDETVTTNPTKAGVTYWLPFAGIIYPPGVGDFGNVPANALKVPVYVGNPACAGIVLHATIPIPLATIQAQTSGTAFNVGPVLPANANVIDSQITIATPISGGTLSAVAATVQGGTDAAGTIIATGANNVGPGQTVLKYSAIGSNPYPQRGGQQLKMTLTATGDTLNHATAGVLALEVFYTIGQ